MPLPANVPFTYLVAGIAAAFVVIAKLSQRPNLDAIPAVGSSSWLGSWWAGVKFLINGAAVVQEGYEKHKGRPFKVATISNWRVIVSSREHVEELQNSRSDEFSSLEATNEDFNVEFTMGHNVHYNPYHIGIIRSQFTRNIGALYPELRDEIVTALDELLDLNGHEWKSVSALSTIQKVVCRATNRVYVGLPLSFIVGRDPDFVALNIKYTIDVVTGGLVVGLFPRFLKPLATRFVTNVPASTRRGIRHLRPIIEERQKYLKEYGSDWAEKPNDFLSWLMDELGPDGAVEELTTRILVINFAAIHTSSNIFTNALYNLAANPQYLQPLREEVEAVIEQDGWSKSALGKMRKIDSFLKETIRMEGIDVLSLIRKAMKDFTFSDGTFIPKGTRINAASQALHHDGELYENPDVFDPFRFVNMSEGDGVGAKNQFAAASPVYLPFGLGKHACPGRFFAATELKTTLAQIVLTYDLKLEDNAARPRSLRIGSAIAANSSAKVMFRKRVK